MGSQISASPFQYKENHYMVQLYTYSTYSPSFEQRVEARILTYDPISHKIGSSLATLEESAIFIKHLFSEAIEEEKSTSLSSSSSLETIPEVPLPTEKTCEQIKKDLQKEIQNKKSWQSITFHESIKDLVQHKLPVLEFDPNNDKLLRVIYKTPK